MYIVMSISITWHGISCFKIKSKVHIDDVSIITDPYDASSGLRVPRTLMADIVTSSKNDPLHNNVSAVKSNRADKDIFVIKSPGEYEVSDVFVYGVTGPEDKKDANIIFRFEIGGFSLAHLGDLNYEPTGKEVEAIGDVDILFVPVSSIMDTKKIISVVSAIDPQIVVPMNYEIPNLKTKAEPVDKLLKELGVKDMETVKSLKLSKKEFGEEMRVVVIEKE